MLICWVVERLNCWLGGAQQAGRRPAGVGRGFRQRRVRGIGVGFDVDS